MPGFCVASPVGPSYKAKTGCMRFRIDVSHDRRAGRRRPAATPTRRRTTRRSSRVLTRCPAPALPAARRACTHMLHEAEGAVRGQAQAPPSPSLQCRRLGPLVSSGFKRTRLKILVRNDTRVSTTCGNHVWYWFVIRPIPQACVVSLPGFATDLSTACHAPQTAADFSNQESTESASR